MGDNVDVVAMLTSPCLSSGPASSAMQSSYEAMLNQYLEQAASRHSTRKPVEAGSSDGTTPSAADRATTGDRG